MTVFPDRALSRFLSRLWRGASEFDTTPSKTRSLWFVFALEEEAFTVQAQVLLSPSVALIQSILLRSLKFLWCYYWVLASFLNGLPLWTTASIHLETMPPSSLSSPLKRLHPFAWCCSSGGFSLIHFLWGEIGALIGLFAHGLAIKKLLVSLSLSAQCNHRTRDKVIITVCAGRLKSPLNSVRYKLVHALEGGNGQIIAPSEISLLLSLYHHTGKSH